MVKEVLKKKAYKNSLCVTSAEWGWPHKTANPEEHIV